MTKIWFHFKIESFIGLCLTFFAFYEKKQFEMYRRDKKMTVIFHFAFLTESEKSYTKIFIFIGFLKAVNEALLFLSSFCTLSVVSYERSSYVNRLVLDDNSTNAHYIIRTYILHQNQKKNIHPYMLYSMFYSITARPNRLCFTI